MERIVLTFSPIFPVFLARSGVFPNAAALLWPPLAADGPSEAPGVGVAEITDAETEPALPYFVILYNDDVHTLEEVVLQVQKAVGVSVHKAFEIVMEAHSKGRAVCYSGDIETCEKVAAILREIKLTVEIDHYAGS
ncbi:MAG: ATP-dependent Clp protease adaptor ClpS [Nitrospirota bacterium]|nr:ATP-dependent Clp protease adaptor ClpS [Nitrospirota bacterium]